MDTRKRRKEARTSLSPLYESLQSSPKRARVHAQRKFAQGSQPNSPALTPVKEIRDLRDRLVTTECRARFNQPGSNDNNQFIASLPPEPPIRPKTEDFLTFLCFRRTPMLPPELEFFETPQVFEPNLDDSRADSPGRDDKPVKFGYRKKDDLFDKKILFKDSIKKNFEDIDTDGLDQNESPPPPPPSRVTRSSASLTPAPSFLSTTGLSNLSSQSEIPKKNLTRKRFLLKKAALLKSKSLRACRRSVHLRLRSAVDKRISSTPVPLIESPKAFRPSLKLAARSKNLKVSRLLSLKKQEKISRVLKRLGSSVLQTSADIKGRVTRSQVDPAAVAATLVKEEPVTTTEQIVSSSDNIEMPVAALVKVRKQFVKLEPQPLDQNANDEKECDNQSNQRHGKVFSKNKLLDFPKVKEIEKKAEDGIRVTRGLRNLKKAGHNETEKSPDSKGTMCHNRCTRSASDSATASGEEKALSVSPRASRTVSERSRSCDDKSSDCNKKRPKYNSPEALQHLESESNVRSRPSRKTKQVAEVYLEIISQRLAKESQKGKDLSDDELMDEDTISISSIKELKAFSKGSKNKQVDIEKCMQEIAARHDKGAKDQHDAKDARSKTIKQRNTRSATNEKSSPVRPTSNYSKNVTGKRELRSSSTSDSIPRVNTTKDTPVRKHRSHSPRGQEKVNIELDVRSAGKPSYKRMSSPEHSPRSPRSPRSPSSNRRSHFSPNVTTSPHCLRAVRKTDSVITLRQKRLSHSPPSPQLKPVSHLSQRISDGMTKQAVPSSSLGMCRKRTFSDNIADLHKEKMVQKQFSPYYKPLKHTPEVENEVTDCPSLNLRKRHCEVADINEDLIAAETKVHSNGDPPSSLLEREISVKSLGHTDGTVSNANVLCQETESVIPSKCKDNIGLIPVINDCTNTKCQKKLDKVNCMLVSPRSKRTLSVDTLDKSKCIEKSKSSRLKKFSSLNDVGSGINMDLPVVPRPKKLLLTVNDPADSSADCSNSEKEASEDSVSASVRRSLFGRRRNSIHDEEKLNEVLESIAKDFEKDMDDSLYDRLEKDLNSGNKSPEKASRTIIESVQKDNLVASKEKCNSGSRLTEEASSRASPVTPVSSANAAGATTRKSTGKKLCEVVRNLQERKQAESLLCCGETEPPPFLQDLKDLDSRNAEKQKQVSEDQNVMQSPDIAPAPSKPANHSVDISVEISSVNTTAPPAHSCTSEAQTNITERDECDNGANGYDVISDVPSTVHQQENDKKSEVVLGLAEVTSTMASISASLSNVSTNLMPALTSAGVPSLPDTTVSHTASYMQVLPVKSEPVLSIPITGLNIAVPTFPKVASVTINPGPLTNLRHPANINVAPNLMPAALVSSRITHIRHGVTLSPATVTPASVMPEFKPIKSEQIISKTNAKQILIAPKPVKNSGGSCSQVIGSPHGIKQQPKPIQIAPKLPGNSNSQAVGPLHSAASIIPGSAMSHVIQGMPQPVQAMQTIPQTLQTVQALPQGVQSLQAITQNFSTIPGMTAAIPAVITQTVALNQSHLATPSSPAKLITQPVFVTSSVPSVVAPSFDINMQNHLHGSVGAVARVVTQNVVGKVPVAPKPDGSAIVPVNTLIPGSIDKNVIPSIVPIHQPIPSGQPAQFVAVNMMPIAPSQIPIPGTGHITSSPMGSIIYSQAVGVASSGVACSMAPISGPLNIIPSGPLLSLPDVNLANSSLLQPIHCVSSSTTTVQSSNYVNSQMGLVINTAVTGETEQMRASFVSAVASTDVMEAVNGAVQSQGECVPELDGAKNSVLIANESVDASINPEAFGSKLDLSLQINESPSHDDICSDHMQPSECLEQNTDFGLKCTDELSTSDLSVTSNAPATENHTATNVSSPETSAVSQLLCEVVPIEHCSLKDSEEPKVTKETEEKTVYFASKDCVPVATTSMPFPVHHANQVSIKNFVYAASSLGVPQIVEQSMSSPRAVTKVSQSSPPYVLSTSETNEYPCKLSKDSVLHATPSDLVEDSSDDLTPQLPSAVCRNVNSSEKINLYSNLSTGNLTESSGSKTMGCTAFSDSKNKENEICPSTSKILAQFVSSSVTVTAVSGKPVSKNIPISHSSVSTNAVTVHSNWSPRSFYSSAVIKSKTARSAKLDITKTKKQKVDDIKSKLIFDSSESKILSSDLQPRIERPVNELKHSFKGHEAADAGKSISQAVSEKSLINGKNKEPLKNKVADQSLLPKAKEPFTRRKPLFKTKHTDEQKASDAFSPLNESSVYAFEPDLETPLEVTIPFYKRIRNIHPSPHNTVNKTGANSKHKVDGLSSRLKHEVEGLHNNNNNSSSNNNNHNNNTSTNRIDGLNNDKTEGHNTSSKQKIDTVKHRTEDSNIDIKEKAKLLKNSKKKSDSSNNNKKQNAESISNSNKEKSECLKQTAIHQPLVGKNKSATMKASSESNLHSAQNNADKNRNSSYSAKLIIDEAKPKSKRKYEHNHNKKENFADSIKELSISISFSASKSSAVSDAPSSPIHKVYKHPTPVKNREDDIAEISESCSNDLLCDRITKNQDTIGSLSNSPCSRPDSGGTKVFPSSTSNLHTGQNNLSSFNRIQPREMPDTVCSKGSHSFVNNSAVKGCTGSTVSQKGADHITTTDTIESSTNHITAVATTDPGTDHITTAKSIEPGVASVTKITRPTSLLAKEPQLSSVTNSQPSSVNKTVCKSESLTTVPAAVNLECRVEKKLPRCSEDQSSPSQVDHAEVKSLPVMAGRNSSHTVTKNPSSKVHSKSAHSTKVKTKEQNKKSVIQKVTKVAISEAYHKCSTLDSRTEDSLVHEDHHIKSTNSTSIAIQCDLDDSQSDKSQDEVKGNESGTQTDKPSKFPLPPSASPFYYLPLAMATLGEKLPAQLVQQMLAKTQGLVGAAEAGLILQQAAQLAQQYHKHSEQDGPPSLPPSPAVKPISPKSGSIALQKALRANLASIAQAEISVAQSSGIQLPNDSLYHSSGAVQSSSTSNQGKHVLCAAPKGLLKIAIPEDEPSESYKMTNCNKTDAASIVDANEANNFSADVSVNGKESAVTPRNKSMGKQVKRLAVEDETKKVEEGLTPVKVGPVPKVDDASESEPEKLFAPTHKIKKSRTEEVVVKRRSGRASTLASTKATEFDLYEAEELRRSRRAKRAAAALAREECWSSSSEAPLSPTVSPDVLRGWPPPRLTSPTPSQSSEGTTASSTPSHRSRVSAPHSRRHSPASGADSRRHGWYSGNSSFPTDPVIDPGPLHISENPNLARAPSFFPSEEEFNEPLDYIEKIRPEAEQFGLCRIVPPSSFRPDCRVNDDMRFTAYKQYIHRMMRRWGPSDRTLCAIKRCLAKQNIELTSNPVIGGLELDLVSFYKVVENLGGLMTVIEKELWSRVADTLRIPKSTQDRIAKLDTFYCKYLLPYAMLSSDERDQLLLEVDVAHERATQGDDGSKKSGSSHLSDNEEDEEEEPLECIVKGKSTALSAFYRIARNVASQWQPDPAGLRLDERYWDVVRSGNNHVCVHSASIDTSEHGYGFPHPKSSQNAKHPWNLKNLVQNPNSVLRSMSNVIGVSAPTLHVGMMFSTVCWYRDPHSLPWIEYLHTGASKIWYGVPSSNEDKLLAAMKKIVPDFIKDSPVWLPSDTAMVPPEDVVAEGVKVCRVVQEPGQFVVVFPGAFTSSVSSGYLISESAFFARPQYFERAVKSFRTLLECCEPSMFSLDRLALSVVSDTRSSADALIRVKSLVYEIVEREKEERQELLNIGLLASERLSPHEPSRKKKNRFADDDDENTCEICRQHLYISLVSSSDEESLYCLHHAINFLKSNSSLVQNFKMRYTYTIPELTSALKQLDERIQMKTAKKSPSLAVKRMRLQEQNDSLSSTSSSNL